MTGGSWKVKSVFEPTKSFLIDPSREDDRIFGNVENEKITNFSHHDMRAAVLIANLARVRIRIIRTS